MKVFGNLANIQPMPNPKPLKIVRVHADVVNVDGKEVGGSGAALVVNANVFPYELLRQ